MKLSLALLLAPVTAFVAPGQQSASVTLSATKNEVRVDFFFSGRR